MSRRELGPRLSARARLRRGFSLIEAMVAAGVLGIGLLGLVKLHASSMRGTVQAESLGRAGEIARQLSDQLAAVPYNQLPAGCPVAGLFNVRPPDPAGGCRATIGPSTMLNLDRGLCTILADGAAVEDIAAGAGGIIPVDQPGISLNLDPGTFRIDFGLYGHPDPINYQNIAELTVWVCWRDEGGIVHEVESTRMVIN